MPTRTSHRHRVLLTPPVKQSVPGSDKPPHGFTLLELLIAMGLTLILVLAIAQFYAFVGETVRDGRAIIEMSGQLRSATSQLRTDLNSITVRPIPPIHEGSGQGCLEIVEGASSDIDLNGDGVVDPIVRVPGDPTGDPHGLMVGDMDDILVMTCRTSGAPYVGRRYVPGSNPAQYDRIESNLAEIIWFTTFKDLNGDQRWQIDESQMAEPSGVDLDGDGTQGEPAPNVDLDGDGTPGEPGEPRYLVRRMLLIRPDLTIAMPDSAGAGENVFYHNDISAHWNGSSWQANSLGDLTQRERRFIHQNFANLAQNLLANTPDHMPGPVQLDPAVLYRAATGNPANGRAVNLYTLENTTQDNFFGEDRVLDNLLAFDVRVYDPRVPLFGDNLDVVGVLPDTNQTDDDALAALQPGDPGYATAVAAGYQTAGYGAYVDLFYKRGTLGSLPFSSAFSDRPAYNSRNAAAVDPYLVAFGYAIYDTWSTFYERDGIDQFNDGLGDQAFNGLDDDIDPNPMNQVFQYGVDDAGEFETSPPYPTPLRGIQVRIRMYEPGTRQTRQATIVADFLLE